jgi:polar amino acid transport system permease protein
MSVAQPTRRLAVLLPRAAADGLASRAGSILAQTWMLAAIALALLASAVWAQAGAQAAAPARPDALAVILRWAPLIFGGFLFNVLVSVLSMALGTVLGLPLGLLLIAHGRLLRGAGWGVVQFFRNVPWLVLLFYVMFLLPFQVHIGALALPVPAWFKAVIGLALPVAANVAEIVRGGMQSIPEPQWSAAEGLAFSRLQTVFRIILPQALRRMLPPWMNLYAILTMATTLISVIGIQDGLTLTRAAIAAESRPELTVPMYLFLLLLFFAYCYPIARLTLVLERRVQVRT